MLKRLFSHSLIYGLAPQIPKIIGVFTLPIITAYLTKLDFGVFGLISAVSGSIAVFANLGLNVMLSNSFYKSPCQYKWAWRQIYGFLSLWNFPYALILATIIWFFIPTEASSNTFEIILVNTLPIILFGPSSTLGATYYQLNQKPFQIAFRSVFIGLLTVGLNVFFIAFMKLGYMGWFYSMAISQFVLQFSYWYPLNKIIKITPIYNFKWRFIKKQLSVSLPTVPHYYSTYLLTTSDRLVMKISNVSTGNIGMYNAANTVSNFMAILANASGQAVGPMLLNAYKEKNEKLARNLVFVLQVVFLCGTFAVSIWMKEIFHFLIKNKELQSVYPLGIILVMAYNYRPMYFGANARLFYIEKTKSLLEVSFIAGLGTFMLNIVLMPILGFEIAAYTTFIGFMYMGYSGYFLKVYKENEVLKYYPLLWLLATIFLTVLSYFIVEIQIVYKILITLFVLFVVFFGLKKIKNNG